jgi:hypothetical protein
MTCPVPSLSVPSLSPPFHPISLSSPPVTLLSSLLLYQASLGPAPGLFHKLSST